MNTYRRLNDAERYYGLSWRGWLSAALGVGLIVGAVRVSPLGFKPTVTITVLLGALVGAVLYGLSGQAIGPGRYAMALVRYRRAAKQLTVPERPDRLGVVLDALPPQDAAEPMAADVDVFEEASL